MIDKDFKPIDWEKYKEYNPDLMMTFAEWEAFSYIRYDDPAVECARTSAAAVTLEKKGFITRSDSGKIEVWKCTPKGRDAVRHHTYHGKIDSYEIWLWDQKHGRRNYGGPPKRRSQQYPYSFMDTLPHSHGDLGA